MTTNKDKQREGYLLQSRWRHGGWGRWKRERKEPLRGRISPPLSSSLSCSLNSFCSAQCLALTSTFSFTSFFSSTHNCHYAGIVNFDLIQQNPTESQLSREFIEKNRTKMHDAIRKTNQENTIIKSILSKRYHRGCSWKQRKMSIL